MKYEILWYGSRVSNQGFSITVLDVSKVDFGRSRSILTEDGCTELYTVKGRVLGDENVSLREVSNPLPKYDDDLLEISAISLRWVLNVIRGEIEGVSINDMLLDVVLVCWDTRVLSISPSLPLLDAMTKLSFEGPGLSSPAGSRGNAGIVRAQAGQQTNAPESKSSKQLCGL